MIEAKDPLTPEKRLCELADHTYWGVRWMVAKHKHTPTDVVVKLVDDINEKVRAAVACNRRTPPRTIQKLADDPQENVRMNATRHYNYWTKEVEDKVKAEFFRTMNHVENADDAERVAARSLITDAEPIAKKIGVPARTIVRIIRYVFPALPKPPADQKCTACEKPAKAPRARKK